MLSLSQKLSLNQKLTPQQIQFQKLLQLNNLALEQRIKTELEQNPLLIEDIELEIQEKELEPEKESEIENSEESAEAETSSDEEFGLEDFMNEVDLDIEWKNKNTETDNFEPIAPERRTLTDHLLEQLHLLELYDDNLFALGEEIIGNLDDDGYLKRDLKDILKDLELFEHIKIDYQTAENLLKKIQKFDPIGIAARNLKECLLIQLNELKIDEYFKFIAKKILEDYYDEFSRRRYDIIKNKMNLTEETLKEVIGIIQNLNPKPGEGKFDLIDSNQITPDFIIEKVEDNWIITLNDKSLPSVTINKNYLEMIESNKKRKKSEQEKNTYKFLKEKFESARWFIACIEQRRETLMKIMRAIFEKQFEFFEKGPIALKPMIYKDIADEIAMDISTISRVVNGKYVQSPMGIHELKYFFSEGLSTDSGEEVSNKHIKERLKEIIENEDKKKPYSDDELSEILQSEGIHIARRTIAKYREQLKLPVARLRKQVL